MQRYHDREWGVPVHSDRRLFEFLVLEGAQAGLSWSTILHKRAGYRRAFAGFDVATVARFNSATVKRLLTNPNIVQNRLKILSVVNNAKATMAVQQQYGTLNNFLWRFVQGTAPPQARRTTSVPPGASKEAAAMSLALREAGFTFVGPTICHAFMQAVGMANGHVKTCFRWPEIQKLGGKSAKP